MKRTLIALFALSSVAVAANYTWVGPENGAWEVSSNWDINNGYYPQSNSDSAFIGDNKSVVWNSGQYFGASYSVTLGENSTLTLTSGGNLNVSAFTIGKDSKINWSNEYALGYGRDFTINYGTFTADSYGQFNVATNRDLWYNNHTVTLSGILDFEDVAAGEGTIKLYTQSGGLYGNNVNYSGLQVINTNDRVTYEIKHDNSGVYITYNAVPEPATATLSLLALAGLAARRRRK